MNPCWFLGLWLIQLHAVLALDRPRFLNRNFKDFQWGVRFKIKYTGLSEYGGNLVLVFFDGEDSFKPIRNLWRLSGMEEPGMVDEVDILVEPDFPPAKYAFQLKESDGGNYDLSEELILGDESSTGAVSAQDQTTAMSSETESFTPFTSALGSITTITITTSKLAPTTSEETPDRSSEPQKSTSKLEKAGIGIGAGLGGLLVIGSICFLFYRRGVRKGRRGTADSVESAGQAHEDKTKIGAVEAEGRPIAELPE